MHVTEGFVQVKGLKRSNAIRILKSCRNSADKETGSVLLECMSNLVANEMYDPSGAGENAEESILAGIHKLQKVSDDLVVVTNEVFSDSMTDNPEMEEYLKLLGKLNLRMGEMADLVTEVVYGIPVERKDIKK